MKTRRISVKRRHFRTKTHFPTCGSVPADTGTLMQTPHVRTCAYMGEEISTRPASGRLPTYLKPYEVAAMLDVVVTLRNRILLRLLYFCAMRVSEAVGLRIEDIDPVERVIRVCHAMTQSGLPKCGKERLVPIDTESLRLIQVYVGSRSMGRVIDLSIRQAQRTVKKLAKNAQIRDPERVTTRTLRHSFAIHWVKRRGDLERLRRILGHSSLATTQIYLQFVFEDVVDEYDRIMSIQEV